MTEMTPEKLRELQVPEDWPELCSAHVAAASAWAADRKRLEALEKENRALRANVSKSVLRRLEGQGALPKAAGTGVRSEATE